MIAIYVLWHQVMVDEFHRPQAATIIERHAADLDEPSVEAFALRLLLAADIDWSVEQTENLVEARRVDLERGRGQPLPARFDTALLLCAAQKLWTADQPAEAIRRISEAVESLPGNEALLKIEQDAVAGTQLSFDFRRFAFGQEP